MIEHIFLDMDGVLVDFSSAALRLHGVEDIEWPRGEWDFPKVLGISRGEFWSKIDSQGSEFWANLEPYPWYRELLDLVAEAAPFSILTSPSLSPSCPKGKLVWLSKHMPRRNGRVFRDFLIGPAKHLLAKDSRVLIDDSDTNAENFRAAGGEVILFPRLWNRQHHHAESPLDYVRRALEKLHSE
ncbi:MAG: hypothetical protein KDA84_27800 [Planctomycetaceae bacterium]|nr:hypothetical protein [Planctomycetaceae bacterium]